MYSHVDNYIYLLNGSTYSKLFEATRQQSVKFQIQGIVDKIRATIPEDQNSSTKSLKLSTRLRVASEPKVYQNKSKEQITKWNEKNIHVIRHLISLSAYEGMYRCTLYFNICLVIVDRLTYNLLLSYIQFNLQAK